MGCSNYILPLFSRAIEPWPGPPETTKTMDHLVGWLTLQPIWKPDCRGRGGNLHLPLVALTHHRFRPKEFSPPISDDDDHHLNIGAASAIPWPAIPSGKCNSKSVYQHEPMSLRMTRGESSSGISSLLSCCVSCSDEWKVQGVERCHQRIAILEMLSHLFLKTKVINNSRIP